MAIRSSVGLLLLIILCGGAFAANRPPELAPIADQEVYIGNPLSFHLSATDPDNDRVYYSGSDLPANAYLDQKSGYFNWMPAINQIGVYRLTFFATDDQDPGLSDSQTITVKVIYRTVYHEKAWGFGVKDKEVLMETTSVSDLVPEITDVKIDDKIVSSSQRSVSATENPSIKVSAQSAYDIDKAGVSVRLDDREVGVTSYSDILSFSGDKIQSLAFETNLANLVPGKHALVFRIGNDLGASTRSLEIVVGELRLIDIPLCFPTPFSPRSGGVVTFQYTLSQDADIDVLVVDTTGRRLKKLSIFKGQEGGKAGLNQITWDGISDMGTRAGNGIYLVTIINRGERSILGKAKLVISY